MKTLLCLGDSYTIGEAVLLVDSFPYQTVQLLRGKGKDFGAAEIIAKTGWTTDELRTACNNYDFSDRYDFVTLLIGVNNQYRGRTVENFREEFESLLQTAVSLANKDASRVFVLSIPDWGVTPFAEGRDRAAIATEIDRYNTTCAVIAKNYHCNFVDITTAQRADNNAERVAEDGLHPSRKEYENWAMKLASGILKAV